MTQKFVFLSNLLMLFFSSGDVKRGQQPGFQFAVVEKNHMTNISEYSKCPSLPGKHLSKCVDIGENSNAVGTLDFECIMKHVMSGALRRRATIMVPW